MICTFETKRCISLDKVCDGNFDCESDSSDEASCPCDQADQERKSSYFRFMLINSRLSAKLC